MKLLKRMLKKEAGQALPMTLILLVLGGLLVVPTLAFMSTNLTANRTVDQSNLRLYAADAGVEEILWNIKYNESFTLPADGDEWPPSGPLTLNIDDRTVEVEISKQAGQPYKITSTATSPDGRNTTVECFLNAEANFAWLFEHALTSSGDINLSPNDVIYGGAICGGQVNGDPEQIRTGEIVEGSTMQFPTEELLSAFYVQDVDSPDKTQYYYPDNGYPSSSYNVSGGTSSNPVIIPALYRNGNLSITGSGYARLGGTLYIDGQFDFSDKDVTLDLNGQTIYATYYNNCSGNAVYFGPDCETYGPGCVIGVGDINFQPKLGQGKHLLGVDIPDPDTGAATEYNNRFLLSKFTTVKKPAGKLSSVQVKCYISDPEAPPAHVKVALYQADGSGGGPGTLVGAVNCTDNITLSSWKPVNFPETTLQGDTDYWLAAISNADIISINSVSWNSKYRAEDFDSFQFPNPATALGPLSNPDPAKQYMLRGCTGGQEFIFLMSVKCTTNLQPNASFYGSVAGNASLNLQPGCFINLVGLPEDGFGFPGVSGNGSGPGTDSTEILTYTIK
jgi:hypothetical protein